MGFLGYGEQINGANRWIDVGGIQFQPSEFAKLSFIIFISALLYKKNQPFETFKSFFWKFAFPFSIWILLIASLVFIGKNLATTLVLGSIAIVTFFGSIKTKYHFYFFGILCALGIVTGILGTFFFDYRLSRYDIWIDYLETGDIPEEERSSRGYQFNQVLMSIGSGGVFGKGIGNSIGKYYFVNTTAGDDNIFALIAEEIGLIGASMVILIYTFLIFRLLSLANKFKEVDSYNYYILLGIATWIGSQAFIHIGANVGLIPLTGQTLPFISLGGSSIIALSLAMGLALNISRYANDVNED